MAGRHYTSGPACAAWPGLIEAYRDRLPVTADTPVITLFEGGTPLVAGAAAVRAGRCRGLPEGRGRQPDRLVQGPGHDGGHLQGGRGRCQGGHLRLHRQHLGLGGGLRGPGRHDLRGAGAAGQDRARQDGPGAGARREACCRWTATSTTAWNWRASSPSTTRSRWSTRSTRIGSTGRRPPRSRSATCSAGLPTSTASRSATPATSPPTGRATRVPARWPGAEDPGNVWLSGCRRGSDRARCAGRQADHHRDRDPDRQPGVLDPGRARPAMNPAA